MNRLDRLQAILTALQSKRVVRAQDLATRFEVSERTIYRDIRALEAGGVPIGAEAGVGYFISEGYHIPPVMFTHEEARALLLGGKVVEQFTDATIAKNFNQALTKVRSVIDIDKRDELETLENDIIINPFSMDQKPKGFEELQIDQIKVALSNSKTVRFDYTSGTKGEHTKRDVEPVGLCYYFGKWHLMAFCTLRKAYRDFRLDRISKLIVLEKSYARHKHPSLKDHLDSLIQAAEVTVCQIEVNINVHRYLESHKYQMGLVKEEMGVETVAMTFAAYGIDTFARWLLMMCDQVTVVSPDELKTHLSSLVSKLVNKHN